MRLDLFILQKFNLKSRSFAENLIKKGKVNVNNVTLKKPSYDVSDDDDVEVFQNDEFESLGGDKLQKAITEFNIDVENLECVDIGASNGGFTDCMLKHGAKVVYAVDVGQTQLNENLLKNKKVVVKDFLNARDITVSDVNGKKDFLTIDVSFISLKLVLPACFNLLKDDGQAVVLVKPQFEVGKKLGKSGIVVNPVDRMKVVNDILNFARELGFSAEGITTVPDNFKNKNVEYLLYFKKTAFVSRPVKSVDLSFIKNL